MKARTEMQHNVASGKETTFKSCFKRKMKRKVDCSSDYALEVDQLDVTADKERSTVKRVMPMNDTFSDEGKPSMYEKCLLHQDKRFCCAPFSSNLNLDVDMQLAEEELASCKYSTHCELRIAPVSFVPLITPPASPIRSQSDDIDICEWPSNLVIDNALTAISELQPPSLSEVLDCNEPFVDSIQSPKSVRSDVTQ